MGSVVKETRSAEDTGDDYATIPIPRYRHATPSGPWPFLDVLDAVPREQIERPPENGRCKHNKQVVNCDACLDGYPQSLFPNWAISQQKSSRIHNILQLKHTCSLLSVEILIQNNEFRFSGPSIIRVDQESCTKAVAELRSMRSSGLNTRILFVDGVSGPALRMLGAIYDIEPFFWSSSLGWIPSRFQDSLDPVSKSDHITITLRFIRKIPRSNKEKRANNDSSSQKSPIEVHRPLDLERHILHPDFFSLHMIRSQAENTIISYHSSQTHGSTSAQELCSKLLLVGQSVYWTKIFIENRDPTFILVSMLWYCLYAWDEALQELQFAIFELESKVMKTLDLTSVTNQLHRISAHLLHYLSLLADFRKAVAFLRDTSNPATKGAATAHLAAEVMKNECSHILRGISRIDADCKMQDLRLKNVMNLGYSRLNIQDSKITARLTEASLKDSKAMKQLSYLTMMFLPAIAIANIFSMNVVPINPQGHATLHEYFAIVIPLTIFTIWIVGAMQLPFIAKQRSDMAPTGVQSSKAGATYKWSRLWWPVILIKTSLTDQAENRRLRGLQYEQRVT